MIRQLLQTIAEENFEDEHYPVLHGASTSDVKPFVLMVKKQRPIYKRPFKKSEFKLIAGLDNYVKEDKKEEFFKAVNSKKQTQDNLDIDEYDEEDGQAKSYTEVGLKAANMVEGKLKISCDFGKLELGKLDEEYFNDPGMNSILQETELDTKQMTRFENAELRLIYSVIYSERFELKGKKQYEVAGEAGFNVPVSIVPPLKAKAKANVKKKTVLPKGATRNTRGPVYFKCVRVDYDKENGRLKLPEDEFLGKSVHRAIGDEKDKEYNETTLTFENEENDLTDEDFKKLDIIKESVLMSAESREKRKERVKKYLSWFEEALSTGKKKLILSDDKPLTPEDRDFLQSIYVSAPPGNRSVVDLPNGFDTDKIQGYVIVLKLINDLSDEQWDEIEEAWAEPEQDELVDMVD
ncbi:uncharacterized protein LOC144642722 [Oculina patagonica]